MAELNNTNVNNSDAIELPVGNSDQRPSIPSVGDTRYNSNFKTFEYWNGTAWSFSEPNAYNDGLILHLDAGNPNSYPGTGTTWFDLSGNNHHGYGQPEPDYESYEPNPAAFPTYSGEGGGSLFFNDFPNGIMIPTNMGDHTAGTHEFWVRKTGTDNSGYRPDYIADARNGTGSWWHWDYNGGHINIHERLEYANPYPWVDGEPSIYSTVWTHYIITGDSTTGYVKLYINGIPQGAGLTKPPIPPIFNLGDRFRIGARYTSSSCFIGYYGGYKIYNRVLSDEEAFFNYNNLKVRFS